MLLLCLLAAAAPALAVQVRLVGGADDTAGLIAVVGRLGYACQVDANVAYAACQQLHGSSYGVSGYRLSASDFGQVSSGPGFYLRCTGTTLDDNSCTTVTSSSCLRYAISCSPQPAAPQPALRLAGGSSQYIGRLEVWSSVFREWGTVCDDYWGGASAFVACQQLFGGNYIPDDALITSGGATSGLNERLEIVMDNVRCLGNEGSLEACPFLSTHNCVHYEDVIMSCKEGDPPPETQVRLTGGDALSGRLEVYTLDAGGWGTVCDDQWGFYEAAVACQQLFGAGYTADDPLLQPWPTTSLPILMDDVNCQLGAESLQACSYRASHNCVHGEDVGISCRAIDPPPAVPIRLVEEEQGDADGMQGRLDVYLDRVGWVSVCGDSFDTMDGHVACQQLYGDNYTVAALSQGSTFSTEQKLRAVNCAGSEDSLASCDGYLSQYCSTAAKLRCMLQPQQQQPPAIPARFVNSTADGRSGTVQLWSPLLHRWTYAATALWTTQNGFSVCQQLVGTAFVQANFTAVFVDAQGWRPPTLGLYCLAGDNITDCRTVGRQSVTAVRINCALPPPTPSPAVRLVGGSSAYVGVLQVWQSDLSRTIGWGTVCDDEWSQTDADVVCRQLFGNNNRAVMPLLDAAPFQRNVAETPIVMDDVDCSGNEQSIFACASLADHNCWRSEEVALICDDGQPLPAQPLRLQGGNDEHEGYLTVAFHSDNYGTVCDDYWSQLNSRIACRQMFGEGYTGYTPGIFGSESRGASPLEELPILWDDVRCEDESQLLQDCPRSSTPHDCSHREDLYLVCVPEGDEPRVTVRLTGGPNERSGRLMLYSQGIWGTVCDDQWYPDYANMVCQQLFETNAAVYRADPSDYELPDAPILFEIEDDCSADRITDCETVAHDCAHYEDVAIVCAGSSSSSSDGDILDDDDIDNSTANYAVIGVLGVLFAVAILYAFCRRRARAARQQESAMSTTRLNVRPSSARSTAMLEEVELSGIDGTTSPLFADNDSGAAAAAATTPKHKPSPAVISYEL
eukprot:PLAT8406.1.p1 GENE.PLAT8406.1~~PLAT8406.1.p1  ORF type:complete len:1030 (-),score=493.81 PLAT8406.1:107-3166(-)